MLYVACYTVVPEKRALFNIHLCMLCVGRVSVGMCEGMLYNGLGKF